MIKWCLSAGFMDTQSRHYDWEGGDVEEIFLESLS